MGEQSSSPSTTRVCVWYPSALRLSVRPSGHHQRARASGHQSWRPSWSGLNVFQGLRRSATAAGSLRSSLIAALRSAGTLCVPTCARINPCPVGAPYPALHVVEGSRRDDGRPSARLYVVPPEAMGPCPMGRSLCRHAWSIGPCHCLGSDPRGAAWRRPVLGRVS